MTNADNTVGQRVFINGASSETGVAPRPVPSDAESWLTHLSYYSAPVAESESDSVSSADALCRLPYLEISWHRTSPSCRKCPCLSPVLSFSPSHQPRHSLIRGFRINFTADDIRAYKNSSASAAVRRWGESRPRQRSH